ncbi:hypothetical protein TNCV_4714261 [Trichonephila clavipes]|nr:hypothetical protein TNCV_4714261 [Trichonephila clavipes]
MRSTVEKGKLKGLMLLCTQNDITMEIDYNDVIDDFAMMKARRKPLLYKYNDSDSKKNKEVLNIEQKECAAFHSRRDFTSGKTPTTFPEDTPMPYSRFEPTRLQTECHNHHTRWGAKLNSVWFSVLRYITIS